MTALTTEAFRQHVQQTPARATEVLARLRQQSAHPEGVPADPLALPGGAAGERAWHDRQQALRRQLKALLAGNKLHAGLVTAALSRPAADGAPETPDRTTNDGAPNDGVTDYVERAGRWIEAVTAALARRWSADPRTDAAAEGATLTGYHRYELARTLVAALQHRPDASDRVPPEQMADYLAAPAAALPPEPAVPFVSAGPETDRALAWSRALTRVAEAAVEAPFNRPLETVLADARAVLTEAVAGRAEALNAALPVPEEAQRIVKLHALQTSARLYAATLRYVHQESARMIERYQALQHSGRADAADALARDYQDRRLGYAGVPHHFQQMMAMHAAQQAAAMAAMAAWDETETPASSPPSCEAARRAEAPGRPPAP